MTIDLSLSLPAALTETTVARLASSSATRPEHMRPVHVVYGGAHLFKAGTIDKLGERARSAMDQWGADPETFGRAIGIADVKLTELVTARVRDKLARRPVEAMCIDFEDGYGPRANDEEDAEAVRAAGELAKTAALDTAIGIRIKALSGTTVQRAIRTLDLFVTTFARATGGRLREGFTVTLPKVTRVEEVTALATLLEQLETSFGARRIGIELMVETPRALITSRGLALPALVEAARGRTTAVHLGAYDLTAELGVTAADQRLDHPYCDLARMFLQLSVSGLPVGVSDGATTV
ncbi:MAG: hypothetical protein K0S65_2989 [Labilithrix sp.]|nr:hypothetical protein [Labilithrix sp.]